MSRKAALIITLIAVGIASRFLFITNFTALGAVAILGGSLMRKPLEGLAMPLITLFLSDLILNNLVYVGSGFTLFYDGAAYVYLPILAMAFISRYVKQLNTAKYVGLSVVFAIFFFVVSNYGVWQTGLTYPLTTQGLIACYIAALPYALSTLAGTLLYGGVIMFTYKALVGDKTIALARV